MPSEAHASLPRARLTRAAGRHASRHERGAMAPIIGASCFVLALLAIGGATLGRMTAARQDTQRAADAAALAASQLVRAEGLPFSAAARARAEALAGANSRVPLRFAWNMRETDRA